MTSITFDSNDFIKFIPLARKNANKKGYLKEIKVGIETIKPIYYCLFGNILYSFDSETDLNSILGIYFLEGCTCKVTTVIDTIVLAITLVGGKKVTFTTITQESSHQQQNELQEWMDCIESNKFIQITRKLDDYESNLLQLQHKTEQNEAVHVEYEQTISDLQKTIKELQFQQQQSEQSIKQLQHEKYDLQKRLNTTESDRLLLLKSRGITPKTLPLWALQQDRKNTNNNNALTIPLIEKLRLWTGSWNLAGKEPFLNIPIQKATTLLIPYIPSGYDVYILGVQDCPSEHLFECIDALLVADGCRRFRLENTNLVNQGNATTNTSDDNNNNGNISSEPSKIISRSTGNFHGIVVYVKYTLFSDIKLLSITNLTLTNGSSSTLQGAIAIAMSLVGRNIIFINSKFDHKNNEIRREQYQTLMMSLGNQLGEIGYHLNEQFHHILWLGDLSFKLVDTSGNEMPSDTVMNMLSDPRLIRTLFDTHDQLNYEKKQSNIFYGYREPIPFPNFYPTYKKIENRPPVNYSSSDWARNTYKLYMKESFFKGGKKKEFIPHFSDRILFYSMSDLAEDLLPESLPSDMYILRGTSTDDSKESHGNGTANGSSSTMTMVANKPVNVSNNYLTTVVDSAKLSVQVDNYRAMNDGEGMTASDHSPVFCTFLLRVRHDHSSLIEAKAKLQSVNGDINDVLSVLSNNTVSVEDGKNFASSLGKSPSKKSYLLDYNSNKAVSEEPPSTPKKNKRDESDDVTPSTPTTTTAEKETASAGIPFSPYSLLPHGIYHVRISEMKLIWGVNEEYPVNVQILFPAPYEVCQLIETLFPSLILSYLRLNRRWLERDSQNIV